MSQITYATISPLIFDVQTQGRRIKVVFQCPVSKEQVAASHHQRKANDMTSRVKRSAQQSLMYSAQRAISSLMRGLFGSNMLGRTMSSVAYQTMSSTTRHHRNNLSQSEIDSGVVEAFHTVSSRFVWDKTRNQWLSANAMKEFLSPFQRQFNSAPITHSYDQKILSRMLVEVAMADGILAQEESDFLMEFLDPTLGSVQELSTRPRLTQQELDAVSKGGVRNTMFMLSWTLALADEDFAPQEKEVLMRFASQLKLQSKTVKEMRNAARGYVIDQALEAMFSWVGHDQYSRQQLFTLADKLGMSQQEALEAEAQFQRRRG